jgi:primosomal protein N' (replication factor Y)
VLDPLEGAPSSQDLSASAPPESPPAWVKVVVARPLSRVLTYSIRGASAPGLRQGSCVQVPLGASQAVGFVVQGPSQAALEEGWSWSQLKSISKVLTGEGVFAPDLWAMCQFASEYYAAAWGEVLDLCFRQEPPATGLAAGDSSASTGARISTRVLTAAQEEAVEGIWALGRSGAPPVALLHGVTGSGKTEVYIELARRTLSQGQGVLILVPEIALTPQLHRRFQEALGQEVGLWHSGISPARRKAQGWALQNGQLRALVGARSALFVPFQQLGLIVVDEEHDPTFKQEDRVRYHARDLAIVRARALKARVVLGSATPSLETQQRVTEGKYQKFELRSRVGDRLLPEVEMVDLREHLRVGKTQAPLAARTQAVLQEVLSRGEQAMVYLNRRGFAAFLLCQDCGEVKNCPSCSLSLTVHYRDRSLRCHVCNHSEPIPEACGACSGPNLQSMGAGTESVETEWPPFFEGARWVRLDRDQVRTSKALERVLKGFASGEWNVLLGTQMLVKGHDFSRVTLVVVVLADGLFRWPDFRAHERAYQILKQVSGRAGRGDLPGRVLIQTFQPQHPVFRVLRGLESESAFYEREQSIRQALGYPPFGRLARLRVEAGSALQARTRAERVAQFLRTQTPGLEVLGPTEAFLEKAKGIYRWELLLKARAIQELSRAVKGAQEFVAAHQIKIVIDIDPISV